jgi:hypothetical protein
VWATTHPGSWRTLRCMHTCSASSEHVHLVITQSSQRVYQRGKMVHARCQWCSSSSDAVLMNTCVCIYMCVYVCVHVWVHVQFLIKFNLSYMLFCPVQSSVHSVDTYVFSKSYAVCQCRICHTFLAQILHNMPSQICHTFVNILYICSPQPRSCDLGFVIFVWHNLTPCANQDLS